MGRTIFHIDIDAFFASVEQAADPSLAGRAVIVGGRADDRSVVASASYEARARGVKTGMPIARARRICPDGVFLRGTFANYERASRQVLDICRQFSPVVEPASIDECYIDMTGTERLWRNGARASGAGHRETPNAQCLPAAASSSPIPDPRSPIPSSWPMRAACSLRDRVLDRTGLHVSIGIGAGKMIARIATDLAKPNGICLVPPGCEDGFLAPMPAGVIPGIGPKAAERLAQAGIRTVADLRLAARHRRLAALGLGESGELLGGVAAPLAGQVRAEPRERRSISRQSSFERDEPDRGAVRAMLSYLVERSAWALRRERLLARRIEVKLRYCDFTTRAISACLPDATDEQAVLFAAARGLLERLDCRRLAVRLVGVCVEQLTRAGDRQMNLFDEQACQRRRRLSLAQDAIRRRFGFSSLVTGRAIELIGRYEQDAHGFRLRTSCLTK